MVSNEHSKINVSHSSVRLLVTLSDIAKIKNNFKLCKS